MLLLIYIPVEDNSITFSVSDHADVIVVLLIVCQVSFVVGVISMFASVITDANPSTIVKNTRTRFFVDNHFHLIF
jgi:hypothetical protein